MVDSVKSGGVTRNRTRQQRNSSKQGQAGRSRARNSSSSARGPSLGPSGLPMLRTSERGTFRRCHWKWWLEFHETIKPKIDVPPLRFGSLIHEALGAYYIPGIRRGPHPRTTFELAYARDLLDAAGQTRHYSKPEIDQAWSEHLELGIDMLDAYIEKYGKDEEWEVLVTEYPFKTIVQHPIRKTPWFWYVGILDGVWKNRSTTRKVIPDHKTARAITLQYLQMDDQATAYWTWGLDALFNARLLKTGEQLDGMLFNFLRKTKKPSKTVDEEGIVRNKPKKDDYVAALKGRRGFHSKLTLKAMEEIATKLNVEVLGGASKVQPSPLHARVPIYRDWYERDGARKRILIEREDMDRISLRGTGEGPPDEAYKNPSQFNCAGCWAFDMCELHEIGQDWQELKVMTTHTWDPYAAHEIREGR